MDSAPNQPAALPHRFARTAGMLGIGHHAIALDCGGSKLWRCRVDDPWTSVEDAALTHYGRQGWSGVAAEGGLILTLIKAASFPKLSPRNADTFIEALFQQNVAFEEDRFPVEWLLSNIAGTDLAKLEANYAVIAASAGPSPAFYPKVRWSHVAGLFESLGRERLLSIATVFATAPYDLRAGWPDLTLWRDAQVCFLEVKAPGDQLHASQRRLISTLIKPLGLEAGIVEVSRLASN